MFLFPPYPAHTITLKRNSKSLVSASKLQTERDKVIIENQNKMIGILEDIQKTLLRVAYQSDMKRSVNLDEYFPIKTLSDITRFLDKSDGKFYLRRDEFENNLYCTVTNTLKLKRPFESTLLSSLFSREFLSSHKWPRYIKCKNEKIYT